MKVPYTGLTGNFVYYKLKYVTLIYKNDELVTIAIFKQGICIKMLKIK